MWRPPALPEARRFFNFGAYLHKFKKVLPHDYDKMLRLIAQMEEKGEDSEQAQIEAFYAMKNGK